MFGLRKQMTGGVILGIGITEKREDSRKMGGEGGTLRIPYGGN